MRADDDVNLADGKRKQNFILLARRTEAGKHLDFNWERRQAM